MNESLITLGYRELAERYDLGSVKHGGDLKLTENGDIKLTRDFDWQIGDDTHNALHRLIVRWRFNVRMLNAMFDQVNDSKQRLEAYRAEQEEIVPRMLKRRPEDVDRWEALSDLIGEEEFAPQAYAGTIMVVLHAMLRRECGDLGLSESRWKTSGTLIAGSSFGAVCEAAANNFRHFDEWASTADATEQQLKSMRVLSDVLGVTLDPLGLRHPFRSNVCPDVVRLLSDGSFETLMDRVFWYARSLTNLK